jgi:hypothetical protein
MIGRQCLIIGIRNTYSLRARYNFAHAIAQVDGGNCTELELTIIFWIQYIVKNSVSSLDMANEEPRIGHLDACTLNDSASIPKLAYSVAVLWTSVVAICNSPWSIVWFSGSSATVL